MVDQKRKALLRSGLVLQTSNFLSLTCRSWLSLVHRYFLQGKQAYSRSYPSCQSDGPAKTGIDSSPSYIRELSVPKRVMNTYGVDAAKKLVLIVVLRDPVKRTYSEYHHNHYSTYKGCNCTFDQWVDQQLEWASRITKKYGPGKLWPPVTSKELHNGDWKLHASFYGSQIQNWLDAGFEPGQFMVVSMDDFMSADQSQCASVVSEVLARASLPADIAASSCVQSVTNSRTTGKEPMSKAAERKLRDLFRPENEKLYALLKQRQITVQPASAASKNFVS